MRESKTGSEKIKIGNNFVFAPNGVSFVVEDRAAFVLDPGGEYFAGEAAPDGSYHATEISIGGAKIGFEWGRSGDLVLGRFKADKDVVLPMKLLQPWPDWKTNFSSESGGWTGTAGASGIPKWRLNSQPSLEGVDPTKLLLNLRSGKSAYLWAGFGDEPKYDQIDSSLDEAKLRYHKTAPTADGEWGDFLSPISRNLANSRIYSSDDHRVAISVSRRWADSPNTEPYFCWDSFFNGALASINDPIAARNTVRAILSWQTPEGLVPNFGHWNFSGGRASNDRSQPPVGSLCVFKMNQRWPDRKFLEEVYPQLLKWHRWWPTARDGRHDGLLEWGSSSAGRQGALWETGWDDTVEYEGAEMEGSTLNAYAVDLNSLWAMDAEYLSRIAKMLGKSADAASLDRERLNTIRLMNDKLWNPKLGIYCSRLWSGPFLERLTPMNFYPLIAGAPSPDQATQMLKILQDPKLFWGEWILPTVSYTDPVWPQQDYWKGKVWAPVNFLVSQGLARYGSPEAKRTLAEKSVKLFMRNWTAKGVCGENYLSSTGEQSSDPHYTWGALLCLIGLENVCPINEDNSVTLDGTTPLTLSLDNIPILGKLYRFESIPGQAKLLHNGKVIAHAEGKVLRVKV